MTQNNPQMSDPPQQCKGNCLDHSGVSANLATLQQQMEVVLPLPKIVEGQSARTGLLILLIVALLLSIIAAGTYSFNAVNSFKEIYKEDREKDRVERIEFRKEYSQQLDEIISTQNSMKLNFKEQFFQLNQRIDQDVKDEIRRQRKETDSKISGIAERIIKIEARIDPRKPIIERSTQPQKKTNR